MKQQRNHQADLVSAAATLPVQASSHHGSEDFLNLSNDVAT